MELKELLKSIAEYEINSFTNVYFEKENKRYNIDGFYFDKDNNLILVKDDEE